ncbi:MAG: SEC-C metal-binding domain-containing protein, partial [Desertimonas sp.]
APAATATASAASPAAPQTAPAPPAAKQSAPAAKAAPRPARAEPRERPAVQNLQTSSSDTEQPSAFRSAADAILTNQGGNGPGAARRGGRPQAAKQETVVKDEFSKTPRNAPCPCGSGKKFKQCHGAS